MGLRGAVFLLYLEERRQRREEWERRMESNIRRWEGNVSDLERVFSNIECNVEKNEERLEKAKNFLDKLTCAKSKDWYDRTKFTITHTCDERLKGILQNKIDDYDKKFDSVNTQINRLNGWISDGYSSLREIKRKISDIEDKICDVKRKL